MRSLLFIFLFSTLRLCAQNPLNVYQIYPRSFCDSNGDGIGDLKGILSKVNYLEELGVDAIWISPFFESPQQDHGYDISNYRQVAPEYGTLEDADSLIAVSHRKGIKVLFDMVLNHTSIRHPWFSDNTKRDWYLRSDGNSKKPPTNWRSLTGGSGWHKDSTNGDWYWASFLPFQPDLNWHNPAVREEMKSVMRFWLSRGVDGFRLDIFNCLYEDPLLRDNGFSIHPFPSEKNPSGFFQDFRNSLNHPLNMELARELRAICDSFSPARILIGEVFGPMASLRKYCGDDGKGLNYVFLFEASMFRFNKSFFEKMLQQTILHFDSPTVPVWVFSNHDRTRSMSLLKGDLRKAKCLAIFQFMARGLPVLYQGEELGMQNARIPLKEGLDPIAAKFRRLPQCIADLQPRTLNRDNVRTPMLWEDSPNAGFCPDSVKAWLPVRSASPPTASYYSQRGDPNSLFIFYSNLIQLQRMLPELQTAPLRLLPSPDGLLVFERDLIGRTIRVLINFSEIKTALDTPEGSICMLKTPNVEEKKGRITLNKHEAAILIY